MLEKMTIIQLIANGYYHEAVSACMAERSDFINSHKINKDESYDECKARLLNDPVYSAKLRSLRRLEDYAWCNNTRCIGYNHGFDCKVIKKGDSYDVVLLGKLR